MKALLLSPAGSSGKQSNSLIVDTGGKGLVPGLFLDLEPEGKDPVRSRNACYGFDR